jgi:hypothetical protein
VGEKAINVIDVGKREMVHGWRLPSKSQSPKFIDKLKLLPLIKG